MIFSEIPAEFREKLFGNLGAMNLHYPVWEWLSCINDLVLFILALSPSMSGNTEH